VAPPSLARLSTCSTSVASWCGGFETGNFSEWDGFDGAPSGPTGTSTGGDHFSLVDAPVIEGNRAFRATVDPGAVTDGEVGQRSLLSLWPSEDPRAGKTRAYQGSEQWYRSAVYFPPDFQPAPSTSFNWLVEWHNWPSTACCANLGFTVVTNQEDGGRSGGARLSLRLLGGGSASTPIPDGFNAGAGSGAYNTQMRWVRGPEIARGHWYDLLVHVKWSTGNDGLVEWWLDGTRMVSTSMPTLFYYADNDEYDSVSTPGPGQTYFMEGYYRPSGYLFQAVVYHDAARIGPTLASVS
jgi:hypothetical protein